MGYFKWALLTNVDLEGLKWSNETGFPDKQVRRFNIANTISEQVPEPA
jgi:hypothetical protein